MGMLEESVKLVKRAKARDIPIIKPDLKISEKAKAKPRAKIEVKREVKIIRHIKRDLPSKIIYIF
jgi:hypothetical protein